jgi:phosphatidylglycerophosphatase A
VRENNPKRHPRTTLGLLIATWFGCGLAPKASGTVGTLGAVPLYLLLANPTHGFGLTGAGYALFIALALPVGFWAADIAGRYYRESDDGRIVIDEVFGFLVTMMFSPGRVSHVVCGFILFRLFDIFKPWPARFFDSRIKNAFGNVMDDLVAGLYSFMVLQGLMRVAPEVFQ